MRLPPPLLSCLLLQTLLDDSGRERGAVANDEASWQLQSQPTPDHQVQQGSVQDRPAGAPGGRRKAAPPLRIAPSPSFPLCRPPLGGDQQPRGASVSRPTWAEVAWGSGQGQEWLVEAAWVRSEARKAAQAKAAQDDIQLTAALCCPCFHMFALHLPGKAVLMTPGSPSPRSLSLRVQISFHAPCPLLPAEVFQGEPPQPGAWPAFCSYSLGL